MAHHDPSEYEARADECERLAFSTDDAILREQLLSLSRSYLEFAAHLRERFVYWPKAVNE